MALLPLDDLVAVVREFKTFKDYEPSFVHMDIKYLPQMPDESHRRYLFVGIDRATRWVFMHIYADQNEDSSVDFLNRLGRAAPMKIVKLLTDNGSHFTDRFTGKKREPSGNHKFDVRCKASISNTACARRATLRPMAWSSVSTPESVRWSIKLGSRQPLSWRPRSTNTSRPTTI